MQQDDLLLSQRLNSEAIDNAVMDGLEVSVAKPAVS